MSNPSASRDYLPEQPTRAEVDSWSGVTVLQFGTNWCGICRAAEPAIAQALQASTGIRHLKVEDGPGLPLGRSFRIKLWPTLIFMKDGVEVGRLVRPVAADEVRQALAQVGST